jgi:hypothetical protein
MSYNITMTNSATIFKKRYEKSLPPSNQCGIFVSYNIDQNGKCGRYIACSIADHTKSPKCPAKSGK